MPQCPAKRPIAFLVFATALATAGLAMAAPTTSRGLISVDQVAEMLEKAPTDRTAQQVLTAYLAGVGEAASAVVTMGNAACQKPLSLNAANAGQALKGTASDRGAETPATPLIVSDMLHRAGCRRP
ncbi:hypothetical protein DFO45_1154 [Azorhizobium sp. AG788]|uniref:chlorophyllide reductase n=1 Tax=Azorhizobium sp. AG788 TaxID=2183897 RepID=UPI0010D9643F|nr:chlorophyllide reductase [Azorhizobium sp. AG788]TDT99446.1 hypothetical protein DFO45_1154 [Azorhizobium sp. AG788]